MVEALFSKILNMSLTGSAVILAVLLARFLLRSAPRIYSYALWAVVLFRLLCPVSVSVPAAPMGVLQPEVSQGQGISTMTYVPVTYVRRELQPAQAPQPQEEARQEMQPSPWTLAAWLWAAGAAAMSLWSLGQTVRLRLGLRSAVLCRGDTYLADGIASPFVLGILRPRVYLPGWVPREARRYVIAHERCHIRRGDHIFKLLAYAALCLHWFNPLVWLAFSQAGKDMEMSCDEAVIRRLPKEQRADYCACLLRLTTRRKIFSGTALAFGEGDTKSRIRHIVRWHPAKAWVGAVSALVCAAILTACALNPGEDGRIIQETDQSHIPESRPLLEVPEGNVRETVAVPAPYQDRFESTDGTVSFAMDLVQTYSSGNLPIVEVEPAYLTGETVRQTARAIFGEEAVFYEAIPTFARDRKLSKGEIQTLLDRYRPYTDPERLKQELYPGGQGGPEDDTYFREIAASVEAFLREQEGKLEAAPAQIPREPCRWTFQNFSYYTWEPDDPDFELWHDDAISAQVTVDGIPYTLLARTMDGEIQENYIVVYVKDLADPGYTLGDGYFQNLLCSTREPEPGELTAIQDKAHRMLNTMGLGQWMVDQCQVEIFAMEDQERYTVQVQAVPVLQGVPALFQEDNGIFNPADISYAFTRCVFRFACDGTLIRMELESPVQITRIVTDQAELLSWEELMAAAKGQFQRRTADDYMPYRFPEPLEGLTGDVVITQAELGLNRVRVEGTAQTYQYIPCVTFRGSALCTDPASGNTYTRGEDLYDLLTISALDGSIV